LALVPRTQEVIFALALAAAGVLAGQVVRQTRRLIDALPATADAGSTARDAEVRLDSKLVAAGLVVVAVLVAAGLLFSAVLGPERLGSYPALPFLVVVCVVFVIAVAAALLEVRQPSGAAPPDRAAGR
jgi:hypothetical protein